jgi:hypothetical protein
MNRLWLLIGFALAWSGCSSSNTAGSGVGSSSAGTSGASAAGTPAAVSGEAGRVAASAGHGPGQAGNGVVATAAGSGGAAPQAGSGPARAGSGGAAQAGGSGGSIAGASGSAGTGSAVGGSTAAPGLAQFSFFVTSLAGLQKLAKKEAGFGGDLRYGEANGLAGADKICSELAESSMPGAGAKGWRAFLSVAEGADGGPVHAIDRVGEGPWYDRIGRIVAMNKAALLNARPKGADPAIMNDLPNEEGVPNQRPEPAQPPVNNHHMLTGSDTSGKLYGNSVMSTCNNWTSADRNAGRPRIGFSYPAGNRQNWISGQDEGGCSPGAVLVDNGGSDPNNPIVGSGGGYGGFYCFALKP